MWRNGKELPHSVCTDLCHPGTRKGIRQGEPICCFDCIPCANGHVSREPACCIAALHDKDFSESISAYSLESGSGGWGGES
uniref:Vomeronasal type-2 receptor 26-like n=1 Tax=Callorhinus ursinus TaxID=34884 RepID=A0A3Q7NVY0_CALUR|nr:vomeronasal type-2 receptor 26-like [Callorhinus ursinus]